MSIFNVISLAGGLALFLYGMNVLSSGLERMAGGKLQKILRKITSNRFKGLLLGALVTAAIQSSAATTVMLVGLVNSGVMELTNAISVIMGSNIGTTITAWILSLSGISSESFFMQMLKPKNFSAIFALVGALLIMFSKKQKRKDIGAILVGFAVLMFGMVMMSDAVSPLGDDPRFTSILTRFSNPVLGVFVGFAVTALLQSSSVSVGILQALSLTGVLTYGAVIPIIMGQNIGACVATILAAIGTNKNAKRVACVHVSFNIIGTVLFLALWLILDGIFDFPLKDELVMPHNIAIIHSIFNVASTIILLPFVKQLASLAKFIIRDGSRKNALLDENLLRIPAFAVARAEEVTGEMGTIAQDGVRLAIANMAGYNESTVERVVEYEDKTDKYEDELEMYINTISAEELSDKDERTISKLLRVIPEWERIGDHGELLTNVSREMADKDIHFSAQATSELNVLYKAVDDILDRTVTAFINNDVELAKTIEPLDTVIDKLVSKIKDHQVTRLRKKVASAELGFVMRELLTNLQRVSGHCSNIAIAIVEGHTGEYNRHSYLGEVKFGEDTEDYQVQYRAFKEQYSISSDALSISKDAAEETEDNEAAGETSATE